MPILSRMLLLGILFTGPVTSMGQFGGKSITLKSAQEVHILKKGIFLRIYAHDGERIGVGYLRKIRDNSVTVGSFIRSEEINYGQIGKITVSAGARIHHHTKKYACIGGAIGMLAGYGVAAWYMRDFQEEDSPFGDKMHRYFVSLSYAGPYSIYGAISGFVFGLGTGIQQLNEDQEYIMGPGDWQIQ